MAPFGRGLTYISWNILSSFLSGWSPYCLRWFEAFSFHTYFKKVSRFEHYPQSKGWDGIIIPQNGAFPFIHAKKQSFGSTSWKSAFQTEDFAIFHCNVQLSPWHMSFVLWSGTCFEATKSEGLSQIEEAKSENWKGRKPKPLDEKRKHQI